MLTRVSFGIVACIFVGTQVGSSEDRIPPIRADKFEALHRMIMPPFGERSWRDIAWETDITKARQRSISEDKPILLFRATDGNPLGRA